MNKKLKALLTCLALTTSLSVISACDISSLMNGTGTDSTSDSVATSTPITSSTASESTPETEGPTISFVVDGEVVKSIMYSADATEIRGIPDVPEKAGYTGAWEAYTLDGSDITVNAVYTAINYSVKFFVDNEEYASFNYNMDNATIIEPTVPAKTGYTAAWSEYVLEGGNVEINAVYTAIEYTVTFTADGNVVATVPYTVEMSTIEAPTIPAKEGYGAKWADYTLDGGNKTVEAIYILGEYAQFPEGAFQCRAHVLSASVHYYQTVSGPDECRRRMRLQDLTGFRSVERTNGKDVQYGHAVVIAQ